MKKLLWLAWFGAVVSFGFAAEPWSRRMTPEEFKAAGLDKLSSAELVRLDALVEKYGATDAMSETAALTAVQAQTRQAEINMAATRQAEARVAEAEARAAKAERDAVAAREAAAKAEQKKPEEGFLAKAKRVIVSPGTTVEVAAVEGEIDGDFNGWEAMTTWRLKDGTVWRVDNKPPAYRSKHVPNPKVKVYPAALGGYWMDFVDLDLRIRVRQLK